MDTTLPACQETWEARYKKSLSEPLAELRPLPRKGSNEPITIEINFEIPDFVHRPVAAAAANENQRYGLSIKNLKLLCFLQFCVSFLFVMIRKPADVSKQA